MTPSSCALISYDSYVNAHVPSFLGLHCIWFAAKYLASPNIEGMLLGQMWYHCFMCTHGWKVYISYDSYRTSKAYTTQFCKRAKTLTTNSLFYYILISILLYIYIGADNCHVSSSHALDYELLTIDRKG